jgi:ADP-ribose pyrophosphatase YjhB (NUDIX family)
MKGYMSEKIYEIVKNNSPILNIDAVIYNSNNKIYLQMRKVIPHKNKWTILGGRLMKNEDIEKCLYRHVSESGLQILKTKFAGYFDWKKCDSRQHAVSLVFLVETKGNPITGKFFESVPNNTPLSVKKMIHKFYTKENINE